MIQRPSTWDGRVACHPLDAAKLVYVEVPKAGCSSIKYALSPWKGGPPIADDIHHWFGYTWATDAGHLLRWFGERWADYFRFSVVRHPLERFQSWYYDKRTPLDRYATDIDRYVEREFERDPWRLDIHVVPQSMILGPDLSGFDFIGRLEDAAAIEGVLSKKLGQTVLLPHHNASSPRPPLATETILRLAQVYAADLEAFGYDLTAYLEPEVEPVWHIENGRVRR